MKKYFVISIFMISSEEEKKKFLEMYKKIKIPAPIVEVLDVEEN